jgi:hypothetical protein
VKMLDLKEEIVCCTIITNLRAGLLVSEVSSMMVFSPTGRATGRLIAVSACRSNNR